MDCTPNEAQSKRSPILDAALEYLHRGWSIIPIKPGTKHAAVSWKKYQTARPTEAQLRKWFVHGKPIGMAVIFGEVSGGLACRDFDTMEAYDRWAADHRDHASTLPTVATSRGRHVYFHSTDPGVRGIKKVGDGEGELRAGGYCLLPPSRHPDGREYRWVTPLPSGPIPSVDDVHTAGLLEPTTRVTERDRENRGQQRITEAIGGGWCVEDAIAESVVRAAKKRNDMMLDLARGLKAIPAFAEAPAVDMKPHVQRWHQLSLPKIGTIPFEESWIDFLHAWPRVKFPKGGEPMAAIVERAKRNGVPGCAKQFTQDELKLLVSVCKELQRVSGSEPFYLTCRAAGKYLGVGHVQAWRWLFLLEAEGIIIEVAKGDYAKHKASRYRYIGG